MCRKTAGLQGITPHGRRWYDYRLNACFDLSKPGSYTLEVRLAELNDYDAWKTTEVPDRPLVCGPIAFKIVKSVGIANRY
jgi:hypothetical protein